MRLLRLAFVAGVLLELPFAGSAQSADGAAPHFYGGLGVYTSSHQNLSSWGSGSARIPVQAVVGYQLRPRLAVQLGLAYSGNRSNYAYASSYSSYYPAPPSTVTDIDGTYTERSTTTSLLARYTLTRKPAHRFQADLLGGAKFEYSRYHDVGTYTSHDQPTPVVTPFDYPSSYTSALLSLGPSLRCRLVSRLEAVYDLTFDLPVAGGHAYYSPRLQATMALGLRYHFGRS